jgi:hypothetical protein
VVVVGILVVSRGRTGRDVCSMSRDYLQMFHYNGETCKL